MSSAAVHWNTPPEILDLVYKVLGNPVDLDPCSNATSLVKCRTAMDLANGDDGLLADWHDFGNTVFVNPPYVHSKKGTLAWARKIRHEAERRDWCRMEILALVPARVDTEAWQTVYLQADAICFLRGRTTFWLDGKPSANGAAFPSGLVYFGQRPQLFAKLLYPVGAVLSRTCAPGSTRSAVRSPA